MNPWVDAHNDLLFLAQREGKLLHQLKDSHSDLDRAKTTGIGLQVLALFSLNSDHPGQDILKELTLFFSELTRNDTIRLVKEKEDLKDFKDLKVLLALEGSDILEKDITNLHILYELGVRMLSLTWNHSNALADGALVKRPKGLSEFGKEVVHLTNALGMIIDVSHLAEPGFWDIIEISNKPIIASHSNAKSLCDHPRNLSDDQIKAIAKTDGVIGVTFVPAFIHKSEADIHRLCDHIDHIKSLVGIDHIGIGSDFNGFDGSLQGLERVERLPELFALLANRGYTEEELQKISGKNLIRVFKEII